MRPTLAQKRSIVDRFHAGESLTQISLFRPDGSLQPNWFTSDVVESVIRWSHKNKAERRRVWRMLTRVKR